MPGDSESDERRRTYAIGLSEAVERDAPAEPRFKSLFTIDLGELTLAIRGSGKITPGTLSMVRKLDRKK